MRERMEQHRANPVCASCHAMMDPLGLSLENFDAVGKWRTLGESSAAIDASGVLPDGTQFRGPGRAARGAAAPDPRSWPTLTEKLLTYALGRGLEYYDAPAVRQSCATRRDDDYRLSSLIAGIVQSAPFRMRMAASEPRGSRSMLVSETVTIPAATDLPARRRARRSRCRCSTPWCRRSRRWRRRRRAPVRRLGFVYLPNGVARNFKGINYWTPRRRGHGLRALADPDAAGAVRDRMTVVSGLAQHQADALDDGANGDHTRGTSSWLTGVHRKRTEGADVRNGISADQIAAAEIGKDTALPSLELAIDLNFLAGQCENSYSCAYLNTLSWRVGHARRCRPRTTRASSSSGCSATAAPPAQRRAQARENRSILDSVMADLVAAAGHRSARRTARKVGEYVDVGARGRAADPARRAPAATAELPTSIGRPASPSASTST